VWLTVVARSATTNTESSTTGNNHLSKPVKFYVIKSPNHNSIFLLKKKGRTLSENKPHNAKLLKKKKDCMRTSFARCGTAKFITSGVCSLHIYF
jgi:hypothetical protein